MNRNRLSFVFSLVFILLLTAFFSRPVQALTTTPTSSVAQVDLTVEKIEQNDFLFDFYYCNRGTASSNGTFRVTVQAGNVTRVLSVPLYIPPPGNCWWSGRQFNSPVPTVSYESLSCNSFGIATPDGENCVPNSTIKITVDSTNALSESNENNNTTTFRLSSIPTTLTVTPAGPTAGLSTTSGPSPTTRPSSTPTTAVTTNPTSSGSPTGTTNCPNKKYGDADCNNIINEADFDIWKSEYLGTVATTRANFNFVQDTRVTLYDLEIWVRGKILGIPTPTAGPTVAATTVPSATPTTRPSTMPTAVTTAIPSTVPTTAATIAPTNAPAPSQYVRNISVPSGGLPMRVNRMQLGPNGYYFGGVKDLGYDQNNGNFTMREMVGYVPYTLSTSSFNLIGPTVTYSNFLPGGIAGNVVPLSNGGVYVLGRGITLLSNGVSINTTVSNPAGATYDFYNGSEITGGVAFVGQTNQNYSTNARGWDGVIVMMSGASTIVWSTTIGGAQNAGDAFTDIAKSGTEFIVGGTSGEFVPSRGSFTINPYVAKISSVNGAIIWQTKVGKNPANNFQVYNVNITNTSDGGVLLAAREYPGDNLLLIKYSSAGAVQWSTTYAVGVQDGTVAPFELADGYGIGFTTQSTSTDVTLLKVQKANGTSIFMKRFASAAPENLINVESDGTNMIGAINANGVLRLFKMDGSGNLQNCSEHITVTAPAAVAWTPTTFAGLTAVASTAVATKTTASSTATPVTMTNSCN